MSAPNASSSPDASERVSIDRSVRAHALALGFDVVGVARADESIDAEHGRYMEFIRRGMHGEMSYLADDADQRRRLDTSAILEGARSVVCVGRRYARSKESEAGDPPLARSIARYARGQDYHNHVRRKLRRLATFIRNLSPGTRARPLCDVEPVMERVWAARSGIGFVGKNGLVITPGQGSYQLLGEVVTTLELTADVPLAERCGACTRCLDACPTRAFDAPFVLDPRRCIAYATIEQRTAPPEELRPAIGEHLFGCDVCQEVCPFNRTAPPPEERTTPFRPLARWGSCELDDLAGLDEPRFAAFTVGTPLRRARREGLARNAALVATNRLAAGASGEDAERAERTLAAAARHDDAGVRAIAAWGRQRAGRAGPTDPAAIAADQAARPPRPDDR